MMSVHTRRVVDSIDGGPSVAVHASLTNARHFRSRYNTIAGEEGFKTSDVIFMKVISPEL